MKTITDEEYEDLYNKASELIEFGTTDELAKGKGMMVVLNALAILVLFISTSCSTASFKYTQYQQLSETAYDTYIYYQLHDDTVRANHYYQQYLEFKRD